MVIRYILVTCCLFSSIISFSQKKYYRLLFTKKPINFYWDWHKEYDDTTFLKGISKQLIFHIDLRTKDSILEKEIIYDPKGRPIIEKQYAVPTKEGVLHIDSIYYYPSSDLVQMIKRYEPKNTSLKKYDEISYIYDSLNRIIIFTQSGIDQTTTFVVYDTNKTTKKQYRSYIDTSHPNSKPILRSNSPSKTEIHYFNGYNRLDSMQVYLFKDWQYTTKFIYDTIANTREAYINDSYDTWLRSRFTYSKSGKVVSLLIKHFPNLNSTRNLDVESKHEYNDDGTTRQCSFYIKGKLKFIKQHVYEFY